MVNKNRESVLLVKLYAPILTGLMLGLGWICASLLVQVVLRVIEMVLSRYAN